MGVLNQGMKSIFLSELFSGLGLTLKYFFKSKVTLN